MSARTRLVVREGGGQREDEISPVFVEIAFGEEPPPPPWRFLPLYKIAATGGWLLWQIGFDGRDLLMWHGYAEGKVRCDRTGVTAKANRTAEQQGLLEAKEKYKLKYKEGYLPPGSMEAPLVKAMKGHSLEEKKRLHWPVATQPKIDGVRMCARFAGGRVRCLSFLNNESFGHLTDLMAELDSFFPYLPGGAMIDGELYKPGWPFTTLISAVKTVKTAHPLAPQVQYHVFDLCYEPSEPFEVRNEVLSLAFSRFRSEASGASGGSEASEASGASGASGAGGAGGASEASGASGASEGSGASETDREELLHLVPTFQANSLEEIKEQHAKHLESGYEGIMVKKRANGSPPGSKEYAAACYRPGRSDNILKYKSVIDEEVLVVGVTEAKGTEEGCALLLVRDERGNEFPVRFRGPFEQRRKWLREPNLVLGKEATICYQELSTYGVPRFPIGKAIRDYE